MSAAQTMKLNALQRRQAAADCVQHFIMWAQSHGSNGWIFRGQSRDWAMKAKVGRNSKRYRPERERQLLEDFRRSAFGLVEGAASLTHWDWLAIAQHHGMPTRLLDWSLNPLVAAYFACSGNSAEDDGAVYALKRSAFPNLAAGASASSDPLKFGEIAIVWPSALVARIVNQRGLFTIHPAPEEALNPVAENDVFVFPAAMKVELQHMLFDLGIDARHIMADIDGLAETLRWQFDEGLGFLMGVALALEAFEDKWFQFLPLKLSVALDNSSFEKHPELVRVANEVGHFRVEEYEVRGQYAMMQDGNATAPGFVDVEIGESSESMKFLFRFPISVSFDPDASDESVEITDVQVDTSSFFR